MNIDGKANTSAFNRVGTMLVFLQGQDQRGLHGSIVNGFLKESVAFHGIDDLILSLDEICDWINCPRRVSEPRFLNRQMKKSFEEGPVQKPEINNENRLLGMDLESYIQTFRAKDVLMITIEYRQNASLQGSVCGKITGEQRVSFRSALELMRLFSQISLAEPEDGQEE